MFKGWLLEHGRMNYYLQTQPNNWSCLGCCAAIITGTTLPEFIKFTGHDGSAKDDLSRHPDLRIGFVMREFVLYLADFNLTIGAYLDAEFNIGSCYEPSRLALLTVKSTMGENVMHQVVRSGYDILDPNFDSIQPLHGYEVLEHWPVVKWTHLKDEDPTVSPVEPSQGTVNP